MRRVAARAVALALLAPAALAGCGGSPDDGPGAAEPAVAPSLVSTPAGRQVQVGAAPEGLAYDARTRTLAVAVRDPTRVLLLDPRTLRTRVSVPLQGTVRHLQLAAPGGPVLVPAQRAEQVDEVSLPDGRVRTVAVSGVPHDATGAGDEVVSADEFGHAISVVRHGAVVSELDDLDQPGGVVADGDVAVVVDVGAFTLSTYDLAAGRRTARVPAGAGPTHVALVGRHRVAVADTRGGEVLVYALDPLRRVGSIRLGGAPYGLAGDPVSGTAWVTLTGTNELVGLDVSGRTPRVLARYPTVRQPDTVAVAPGARTLWVTGTADGVVQRIAR